MSQQYRRVGCEFLEGEFGRAVRGNVDAIALAFHVLTVRANTKSIGLFRYPIGYQSVDLGMPIDRLSKAWETLSRAKYAFYDPDQEVVFVRKSLAKEWAPENPGSKPFQGMWKTALGILEDCHKSFLCNAFIEEYARLFELDWPESVTTEIEAYREAIDSLSIPGFRIPDSGCRIPDACETRARGDSDAPASEADAPAPVVQCTPAEDLAVAALGLIENGRSTLWSPQDYAIARRWVTWYRSAGGWDALRRDLEEIGPSSAGKSGPASYVDAILKRHRDRGELGKIADIAKGARAAAQAKRELRPAPAGPKLLTLKELEAQGAI